MIMSHLSIFSTARIFIAMCGLMSGTRTSSFSRYVPMQSYGRLYVCEYEQYSSSLIETYSKKNRIRLRR